MNIDDAVIARIKKQNQNFEILVDCEKALAFRRNEVNLDDVLVSGDYIFKDVRKAEHANEHDLMKIFQTKDHKKIATIIIKEGEVQLTSEYKAKLREEKRKKIINLISRNAVDPKTNIPHPPQRIENAMNEVKVKIDEFKNAEEQVNAIVDKIRTVIPISYEIREIELLMPATYSGRAYGTIKMLAKIIHENWMNDGSLKVLVEVPAGLQSKLFDELNSLTHGHFESNIKEKK